ncbi:MAG: Fe-S cluster assembly ATPase SufC [Alphaproteobacteria bacterium]|nr:Fe-S cluster assembly ATPase SufC [Alphaproteobacteria bacterium]
MLDIKNLKVNVDEKQILNGVDLHIGSGETHILMGKNGSGKSSLLNTVVKNPKYKISGGDILFLGESILEKSVSDVAKSGIFLSFQNPPAISGLSVSTLLKNSVNSVRAARGEKPLTAPEYFKLADEYCKVLEIPKDWLKRQVNVGFSGGEKKKLSMLEMLFLQPKLALLDEPDSGVDVDAVNIIAKAIDYLRPLGVSFLIVSHYEKLISLSKPNFVHVMQDGKIVKTGDIILAEKIIKQGFGDGEK